LPEAEPVPAVFTLLVAAMEVLEKDPEPARVARCFELSLLDELGFRPVLNRCMYCGRESGPFYFDSIQGSLVCQECPAGTERISVSGAAVAVMKRFLDQGFHRLSVCTVSAQVSREIQQVCTQMFQHSAGVREIKSKNFLDSIEKAGG
jgi:DNA repair protein RecO (recombination protein O)